MDFCLLLKNIIAEKREYPIESKNPIVYFRAVVIQDDFSKKFLAHITKILEIHELFSLNVSFAFWPNKTSASEQINNEVF